MMEFLHEHDFFKILIHLLAAIVAGGIIGLERSYHGRPAGFRTHTLVCLASSLLMLVTMYQWQWLPPGTSMDTVRTDPTRMAQGIMMVLGGSSPTEPTVLNSILNGISQAFAGLSGTLAAVVMYLFQSVFNFFVVSGSGQAALTMPIMAPLADLMGVTRQTSVLAFQLGDALTNLIIPTSGCLMGSLAITRMDWSQWIKFMWKFLGVLTIMAVAALIIAGIIGF